MVSDKDFVAKRVLLNGLEVDMIIPKKALSQWKGCIIGDAELE